MFFYKNINFFIVARKVIRKYPFSNRTMQKKIIRNSGKWKIFLLEVDNNVLLNKYRCKYILI
jgi:hypothetical protein